MRSLPEWLRRQRAQQLVNFGRVRVVDGAAEGRIVPSGHPDSPFVVVRDVYVAGRPTLAAKSLDPPFEVIAQSLDYHGQRGMLKRFLRNDLQPDRARRLDVAMLLGSPPHPFDSFWHWTFESVLKAILAEERGFGGVYLVPPQPYARQSLALIGIAPSRIVVQDANDITRAKELWVSPHYAGHKLMGHPDLLTKLRSAMLRSIPKPRVKRRVYISRNLPGVVRPIINEAEFKTLIARFRFEEYFCEDHDIAAQVAHLASAEAVIGSDGAGLAVNALYMPEGSLIVSLFSPLRFGVGGTLMPSKLLKHRYYPIMPYIEGPYPHGDDVIANLAMIEAILERELA